MTITLTIDSVDSLPDGGPIRFQARNRGFEIGRQQHLDWTLPDPSRYISGQHCEVRFEKGGYWMYDVSRNGTFLNGSTSRMKSPYRLTNGDRLTIGHYIVRVAIEGDDAPRIRGEEAEPAAPVNYGVPSDDIWGTGEPAPPPIDRRDLTPPSSAARAPDFASQFVDFSPLSAPRPAPGAGAYAEPAPDRNESPFGAPTPAPPAPPVFDASPFPGASPFDDAAFAPVPPAAAPRPPQLRGNETPPFAQPPSAPPPVFAPEPAVARPPQPQPYPPMPPPTPGQAPQGFDAAPPAAWSNPSSGESFASGGPAPYAPAAPMPFTPEPVPAPAPRGAYEGAREFARFMEGLAAGAGLQPTQLAAKDPGELGFEIGEFLKVTVDHMAQLLRARAAAKAMTKSSSRTMIGATDNNPLKFIPGTAETIDVMFTRKRPGFLGARESLEAGFGDLKRHEMATWVAMQKALSKLLDDFSPEAISTKAGSSMLGSKKARSWEIFQERWEQKTAPHENGMLDVFLAYFAEAYDEANKGTSKKG
jgi:type VI secretion system protein ImpI